MKKIAKILLSALLIAQGLFLAPGVSAAITATTDANPTLPTDICGLDIAIVMDQSWSLTNNQMSLQKIAFKRMIRAFAGTPTQFSITKFSNNAQVVQEFTDNTADLVAAINGIANNSPSGESNRDIWLIRAQNRFDPRAASPDVIIFATDGHPNRFKTDNNPSKQCDANSSAPCDQAYNHAINAANLAKADGVRVLGIGLGLDTTVQNNLKLVTWPNEYGVDTNNMAEADVIFTNFSGLEATLAEFAATSCGGTITVNKAIDDNGAITNGGAGWMFDVAGSTQTTDAIGQTTPVNANGTVDATEISIASGFVVAAAECMTQDNTVVWSLSGTSVLWITVGAQDIVTCTFTNADTCGNTTIDAGETCDDGPTGSNRCTTTCQIIDNLPTAEDDTIDAVRDTLLNIDVLDNDDFGFDGASSGTITLLTAASNGTAEVNDAGTAMDPTDDFFKYTPDTWYLGTDTFTYEICDSDGDCNDAEVTITVEPPVAGGWGNTASCGNAIIDTAREECDLGAVENGQAGSTCSAVCKLVDTGEEETTETAPEGSSEPEEETTEEEVIPTELFETGTEEIEPMNIWKPVFEPMNIWKPVFN